MKQLIIFDIILMIVISIFFAFIFFFSCTYIRNDVDVDKMIREPGRLIIKEEKEMPPIKGISK